MVARVGRELQHVWGKGKEGATACVVREGVVWLVVHYHPPQVIIIVVCHSGRNPIPPATEAAGDQGMAHGASG